ncbi:amastigote surface protein [Trypanosoma cruzi Dm28c]|uniref:Amastigote surface protein n=1 Tax=Trypanosoma cruzi Dm28c TaxID=1416333 RepID=V5A3E6_TRYCR|nr:amastigote surface protein [Trypanosoma cruzi Dm28c]
MQPHTRHAAAEPHGDADGDAQRDADVDAEPERSVLQSDAVRADGDAAGDGDGGTAAHADPDGIGEQHAVVERRGVPDTHRDDDGGWWGPDAERHPRRWERRPDAADGGAAAAVSVGKRPAAWHAPELRAGVDGAAARVWRSVGNDAAQRDVGAQRDESVHRPGAGCASAPRLLHSCRRDDSHSMRRCGGVRRLQGSAAWVLYDHVQHAARCQRPLGDHRRCCGCGGCCRGGDRRAGLHPGDAVARRVCEDVMRFGAGACEHRCTAVLLVGVRCP